MIYIKDRRHNRFSNETAQKGRVITGACLNVQATVLCVTLICAEQVSHTFCHEFISLLLKDVKEGHFGRTDVLLKGLKKVCIGSLIVMLVSSGYKI